MLNEQDIFEQDLFEKETQESVEHKEGGTSIVDSAGTLRYFPPGVNCYKMTIAYDGTDYYGWQKQPGKKTIEQSLIKAHFAAFKKELRILGASRTDAGVHALGQVVRFYSDLPLSEHNMRRVWNSALPNDIVIRTLEKVDLLFHPHKNVAQKTYWYHFSCKPMLPGAHRYAWYFRYPINEQKMRDALQLFVGTHDFASFATEPDGKDTIRHIDSIKLIYVPRYNLYRVEIKGPSFLRYMIRRLVGACLMVACRDTLSLKDLQTIFDARDPEHMLTKASARGLCLRKIVYK